MNIDNLLTTSDLQEMFGVTAMTIYNWRKKGLPEVVIPGRSRSNIRFNLDSIISWAEQNNIKIKKMLNSTSGKNNVGTNIKSDKAPAA